MKINNHLGKRVLLFFLSVVSLFMLYYFFQALYFIEFPDGHKTELGEVSKKIYSIYIVISILFTLIFFYLGWNIKKRQNHKRIRLAVVFFTAFVILAFVVSRYLYLNLKHGQGG